MTLSFPAPLTENLILVSAWLKNFTNLEIEIGGGTVLAARWQHRLSTDIELFYSKKHEQDVFHAGNRDEWLDYLADQQQRGNVYAWDHYVDGDAWQTEHGSVSLFCTFNDDVRLGKSVDVEPETGLLCQTTSNILFSKIQGRMIHHYYYTACDAYDIVCAHEIENENFNRSLRALPNYSKTSLERDVDRSFLKICDFDKLRDVKYENLASSAEQLEKLAGQILTNTIDAESTRIINGVRERI